MTTTPAATPAVQEPRVSDGMLARLVFDAEAENWSPSSAWYWPAQLAFDLRDARATIASQAEALAAMKASTAGRAKALADLTGRAEAAEAALKAAREALGKCKGYMLNAVIDLETGTPKATTKNTLNGGIRMIDEAIARAHTP